MSTGAQTAGLKVGESLTIEQLLYLTMVHSACDACQVLAEFVSGSTDAFVAEMNSWVQSLGCKNTHFVNPDGLHDPNHYSTAADLAKITLKALQNDTFERISTTVQYKYKNTTFTHTNLMLQSGYVSYYYEYASGIKTGSTEEAGYCVITKASKDGYNYLAVVLGAPVIDYNSDGYVEKCSFIDAASLFDWAFDSLKYTTLVSESDVIDEVPVENGKDADAVQLVAAKDVNTIVPAGLDKSAVIIRAVDKPESVQAPVEKGQKICKAEIVYADQVVATVQLVAANRVELSTFLKILNAVKAFFSLTVVRIVLGMPLCCLCWCTCICLFAMRAARASAGQRKCASTRRCRPPAIGIRTARRTCRPRCIDKEKIRRSHTQHTRRSSSLVPGFLERVSMKIIVYTPKYRDDLIFMVLAAKDAFRPACLRSMGDLLDLDGAYFSKGDCFWIMLDERDRVVGSVGCNLLPDGEAVIHRLYVKADLKRQAFGSQLLQVAEDFAKAHGRTVMKLHLGEKNSYFESRYFYPKHGYVEYRPDYMRKTL